MDGTQVSVPMMHQSATYGCLQGAGFQAVRIPYGAGRFSMLVLMPDAGTSLNSFVAGLTPDRLNGWAGQLQTGMGNLSMPKFTATYGASLVQPLSTLGMQAAFCGDSQASFPGIGLVCIQDVEHKTVVEVDESGTVAAGATTITVTPTAVPAPLFTLTLDHPFLYAIRDNQAGELLFIGTMANPSE